MTVTAFVSSLTVGSRHQEMGNPLEELRQLNRPFCSVRDDILICSFRPFARRYPNVLALNVCATDRPKKNDVFAWRNAAWVET